MGKFLVTALVCASVASAAVYNRGNHPRHHSSGSSSSPGSSSSSSSFGSWSSSEDSGSWSGDSSFWPGDSSSWSGDSSSWSGDSSSWSGGSGFSSGGSGSSSGGSGSSSGGGGGSSSCRSGKGGTTAGTTASPPPAGSCGQKNDVSRIVCGQETAVNEWPWMAALVVKNSDGSASQFCGGSLIAPQYVVTASHCLEDGTPASQIQVWLGSHDLNAPPASQVKVDVAQIILHPQYNQPVGINNDIALLRLASPVTYNSAISPVCLPEAGPDFAGETATVTGWGRTSENGPASSKLLEVEVPVITNAKCTQLAPGSGITDQMLCAAFAGGKDSCYGDSGGPLVHRRSDGSWELIGVVSFGTGECAQKNKPGVYARVNTLLDFISSNTN